MLKHDISFFRLAELNITFQYETFLSILPRDGVSPSPGLCLAADVTGMISSLIWLLWQPRNNWVASETDT